MFRLREFTYVLILLFVTDKEFDQHKKFLEQVPKYFNWSFSVPTLQLVGKNTGDAIHTLKLTQDVFIYTISSQIKLEPIVV